MKKLGLLPMMLVAACTGSSDWVKIGESKFSISYVDKATISKTGEHVQVWEMSTMKKKVGSFEQKKVDSVKRLHVYSCGEKTMQLKTGYYYYKDELVTSLPASDKWAPIVPDTMNERIFQFVCQ